MDKKKTLLITDDPDLLFAYETMLSCRGYAVSTAQSASEIEKQLKLSSYKIAVIDITTENAYSWHEATDSIKRVKPEIPVISLTLVDNISADISEDNQN